MSPCHHAGAVAEEAIGSVRTVHAFNGGEREGMRYASRLDAAATSAIGAGVRVGILIGFMLLVIFCSYAAGMVWGAHEVSFLCITNRYCTSFLFRESH